jgi:hypothetical protein
MPNSFGSEHNSIVQVLATSAVSLSSVKESRHFLAINLDLFLRLNDILSKRRDFSSEIFFIYHIETCNHLY